MAKNRFSNYSNQQTSSMSPPHTYTVGVATNPLSADDEDLDDICPVCDGECTCSNRPKPRPALPNNINGNAQPATTINNSNPVPGLQSLKIKLTVPPGMLSKARAAQAQANAKKQKNIIEETATTGIVNDGEGSSISPFLAANQSFISQGSASGASGSDLTLPKRRGRPPKGARELAKTSGSECLLASVNEANTLPSSSLLQLSRSHKFKKSQSHSKPKRKPQSKAVNPNPNPKGKGTTVKKGKAAATTKKKTAAYSDDDFGSELTELDEQSIDDDDDYDTQSVQYPTFMSASAMSSSAFSEDSEMTSSSGFDTDSSMEAEEENYILSEERRHERARVRRELLGEDVQKRKDPHNNWVIRPRKQSVGLDDADMDVDSDATEDDDDTDEEEEDEEDAGDEDEIDEINPRRVYAGVATGWSDDDEESSFDADLFFANLLDSDGESGSGSEDGEGGNQSDVDTGMAHHAHNAARLQMDNLPFEVSQGWDGQIVFTTGLGEGQGILDLDFEVSAAQLVEDSASPSQEDSDVEMQTSDYEEDGEYEEMGEFGEEEASDGGDTTDDDYVDKNGLPTSRMLDLFHWPSSLSTIDPMSTVSPTASPSPHNRRRNQKSIGSISRDSLDSPRPADILAGKVFWDDSEDHNRDDVAEDSVASSSRGPPVMGQFYTGNDHPRRAILTGDNKDAPSPFPRLKHKRKTRSLSGSLDQLRGRALTRPSSLSVSTTSSVSQVHSSEEHSSHALSDHGAAEAIDIHDVLDVSFLDPEPLDPLALSVASTSEGEEGRHIQSVHRWDHVPMGTFRRTRESGAIISDSGSASWQAETPRVTPADSFARSHSRVLKSSPFSEITWHGRGSTPPKGTRQRARASRNIAISPVILPVRDGDRTPTNIPAHSPDRDHHDHSQRKTRKELRRESKMKRKSYGVVHQQQQHRQYFHHNHHPNSKSRSTSSMQRTNFFNSPTSSVPPLNL